MTETDPLAIVISGPEFFHLVNLSYDVRKAKEILRDKPRDPEEVDIRPLFSYMAFIGIDEHDDPVDLRVPLILAHTKYGGICIDGWHRIQKAYRCGETRLPARYLSKAESEQCRVKNRRRIGHYQ